MYIGNSVDTDEGKISLSGIVTPGGPGFTGTGTVATVSFKVLAEAEAAPVSFDFTPGATTDCNIAEHATGNDILNEVINGAYTLGAPADAPTVDIKGDSDDGPITIDYGGSVLLTWSVTGADSCVASGDWSGSKPTSGSQDTGELTSSKTYTLTCTGAGGSGSDSIRVNVDPLDDPGTDPDPGDDPGTTPISIDPSTGAVKAASTGITVSISLLILAIILATASLIYLLTRKDGEVQAKETPSKT